MLLKYIDREVKRIRREWQTHRRKIAKQISPSQRSILTELDDIFFNATAKLSADLQDPTLTIVTTGTTSSGKSTLVNLLCGAEIIPVAVQEMSAGLVSIEYSQTTAIHIDRTPGALWECGDWYHISDREICDRLTGIMNSYLEAKYNGSIDHRLASEEKFIDRTRFEQELCLEISKWADKSSERNIIKAATIKYAKIQSDRFLNRIDRAVKISIKFRHVPKLFQQLGIYCLSWFNR